MKRRRLIVFSVIALIAIIIVTVIVISIVSGQRKNIEFQQETSELFIEEDILQSDPIPSLNPPIYSGQNLSESPFIGSFINSYVAFNYSSADDVFADEASIPRIKIEADGSFIMAVNAYDIGMVTVFGRVEVKDTLVSCTIDSIGDSGFIGDDLDGFTLRLVSEDDISYEGESLGTITTGDIFTRIG
ncbi:MAG: hypothetical protein FWG21_02985 [Oscillospiraceae bacterium]|nr:hypothetical protein [Oscillospiraceae bacterium]